MSKKIVITGATGFTGAFVVQTFQSKYPKSKLTLLVRDPKKLERKKINISSCRIIQGELENPAQLLNALQDQDVLVNIASLGFGHAPNIIEACRKSNIKKLVCVSTTGIFTKLNPDSKAIRLTAEESIRNSGIPFVIIRPTMIFGEPGDRNFERLIKYLKRLSIIPVLGTGEFLQQPVYVKDLASVIVSAAMNDSIQNKIYNVSGDRPLTYNQVIDLIASTLRKKRFKIHIPLNLSLFLIHLYHRFFKNPKIKPEQVLRLNEHKAFSHEDAAHELGYKPTPFENVIKHEIEALTT